ncbi:MAG: ferritin [Verrucomicrobia bacterium]|nr:MAG: ferritin [Verrucomicrobiota bacterium]
MLTSQKVIDAINEQIGYEFSAELQYYAIAAHFAAEALPQLSQHFFQQAEEEKGHALRFIKYVVDAGGRVVIPAIDAPKSKFKTPRDAVKLSLDQEIHVTQQINGLVGLARKQNDYITINFLQWFLTEQLEEVSSMDNLLKIIERAGTDLLQADEFSELILSSKAAAENLRGSIPSLIGIYESEIYLFVGGGRPDTPECGIRRWCEKL